MGANACSAHYIVALTFRNTVLTRFLFFMCLLVAFMNMDESFTQDDPDMLQLEQLTQLLNKDDFTVCSCRGTCLELITMMT